MRILIKLDEKDIRQILAEYIGENYSANLEPASLNIQVKQGEGISLEVYVYEDLKRDKQAFKSKLETLTGKSTSN